MLARFGFRTAVIAAALLCAVPARPAPPPLQASPAPAAAGSGPCRPAETAVVVETGPHRMHLCERGAIARSYVVALGVSGVDKRREGDLRTPLGTYALGPPRASRSFHLFVPVGYPTPTQARLGYSGGAIGIHGPPRGLGVAARLLALVATDWTAGCIAVATDQEIDEVAAWVRAREVRQVRLVP